MATLCDSPDGQPRVAVLPYLVLLRAGFTLPRTVTSRAVRSYRTFSPLPGMRPAVCFLWHFPWARTLQALPGALSEGARTFLCLSRDSDCLANSGFSGPRILKHFRPPRAGIREY